MNRNLAHQLCRDELNKYGLKNWGIRLNMDANSPYLGLCIYRDKVIVLNAHHIDIHSDKDIINTIRHEIAHALTPGQAHSDIWANKAKEIGCDNTLPCSNLSIPEHVINAIRSGQLVELVIEEETHVIRKPKYVITQLKDKCPECGKDAKERFVHTRYDKDGTEVKVIILDCFHVIEKRLPKQTPFHDMISYGWQDEIKSCIHSFPINQKEAEELNLQINQCKKCNEFKLYKFQVDGAKHTEAGLAIQKGFGIFDDMGLGKTVQSLGVIKYHPEYTPTLYIVKSALLYNWYSQIIRWLGYDYLPQVIKTSRDFVFPNMKSYIISYDLLKRFPKDKLEKLSGPIKCVVMDECQQIKNVDSTRTQEVRKLVGRPDIKVIALSGTPWKNRGNEFFPVLNMINPIKFGNHQNFLKRWVDYYWDGKAQKMGGIRNIPEFKEYTADLLIRREYNEVMEEFPEINKTKLPIELDDLSQNSYNEEVSDFVKWYNDFVLEGTEDSINSIELLGRMARMRHITGLAKIPATVSFTEEFIESNERKLAIFVHHQDVMSILTNDIQKLVIGTGIKVFTFTADLSPEERYNLELKFNEAKRAIVIGSTLASGEGINLQTCADCIMHERQWNPANENQAAPGRFRRIGQKSKVINITFVEANETIDTHLDDIVTQKDRRFHKWGNKSEFKEWDEKSFATDLANRIVAKHKEMNKGKEIKSIKKHAKFV